ncbi:MAG: hypothetical protein AAF202_06765 [Pseudomonadota bacterium]
MKSAIAFLSLLSVVCFGLIPIELHAGPGGALGRLLAPLTEGRTFARFRSSALRGEFPSMRVVRRFDLEPEAPGNGMGMIYRHRTPEGVESSSGIRVQTLFQRRGTTDLRQSDFSLGVSPEEFERAGGRVRFLRPRQNPNGDHPEYDGIQFTRGEAGFPERTQNF